jgi:hypothetical protein
VNACADIPNPSETIAKMVEALKEAAHELYDSAHSSGDPSDESNMQSNAVASRKVTEALAGVRK